MSATVSLTDEQVFTAVRGALLQFGLTAKAPDTEVPIVLGQVNRVPEPTQDDFLVIWPLLRQRLAMNIDTWADIQVTGSITGLVLDVTAIALGPVQPGQMIYGEGVTLGAQIVRQLTGETGSIGTYQTTPTADVSSETLYLGTKSLNQKTELTIQCDVHGPASADNAQRITTLWRDEFGYTVLREQNPDFGVLYTSDPRQMPFTNAEQQWEDRWVIDLCLEADITVTVTQQFADQLVALPIPVDLVPVP